MVFDECGTNVGISGKIMENNNGIELSSYWTIGCKIKVNYENP
jgi:hypothetical protein